MRLIEQQPKQELKPKQGRSELAPLYTILLIIGVCFFFQTALIRLVTDNPFPIMIIAGIGFFFVIRTSLRQK